MSDGKPAAIEMHLSESLVDRVTAEFHRKLDENPETTGVASRLKALKKYTETNLKEAIFGEGSDD